VSRPDDPTFGIRIGDVYLSRHTPGMTFTVESLDLEHRLAFGRRNTSRRRRPIDLRNLAMANRYTRTARGPDPETKS
jgi:hypothetical protein